MAITINKQPTEFHSAYNPINLELDSTNKTIPGFRYMVRLTDTATNQVISELKIAPDPFNNNYGTADISRIIQNYVEGFLDFTLTDVADSLTSYFNYTIEVGESYVQGWDFDDYIFVSGGRLALTTDSAYGPGFSNATHNFSEGDQIKVRLSNSYSNSDTRNRLNDYWEVLTYVTNKTIIIGNNYGLIGDPGAGAATPGRAVESTETRVIEWDSTKLYKSAINTAMDLKEYSDTKGDLSLYNVRNYNEHPNIKVLTNQPLVYKVTLDQYVYFNLLNTLGADNYMWVESNVGSPGLVAFNTETVSTIGVGPGNLPSSIEANMNFDNLQWYTVGIAGGWGDPVTPLYKFVIDRRCKMNDTQILFMDRKGSYNSFAFQLRNRENVKTSKESYNKQITSYNTYSKGTTVYHSEAEKNLDLVTNFMGEAMNLYYEEMMTSRNTYIKWKGIWYACIVTDTTFENEFERNNKMIKKTVNVKFAVNNPIN